MYGKEVITPEIMIIPVKKGEEIQAGTMVCIDASGLAVTAVKDSTVVTAGIAQEYADARNVAADGDITVQVKNGTFLMEMDATITADKLLKTCYVVDARTVTATDTDAQAAGKVVGFMDGCVAVKFN